MESWTLMVVRFVVVVVPEVVVVVVVVVVAVAVVFSCSSSGSDATSCRLRKDKLPRSSHKRRLIAEWYERDYANHREIARQSRDFIVKEKLTRVSC